MRLASLLLVIPAICLAQAPVQSRLVLDATDHDFGTIAPGTIVTYRFKATNAGNAPLTLGRPTPSCGCTSSVVGKAVLAPGESTELEVSFNPEGESGPVHKSVRVNSDAAVDPIQTVTFEAVVLPDVQPSASTVQFRDLARSDRRQASVQLKTGTGQPIRLAGVDLSEAPWLGVATREDGKDLWVDFDLLAGSLPKDKLQGDDSVTLRVANPRDSEVKLCVHWELRAPVTATPARVAWSEPAGQDLRASVQLASRDHKPFRILSARTSNPLLMVSGLSPRAAVSQGVQLRLSPAAAPGTYEEKAFLTLDSPGHPEFEIRVAASLR
jgi:hypothetical protein